jgi:hypothetical protein
MTAMTPHPHLPDRSQVLWSYPLTLATRGAIQTYNRTVRRVDAALYLAQIIVRVQGAASRQFAHEIDQVNAALDDELRRLEEMLAAQHGWLTKRRAASALEAEGVIYTDPVTAPLALRTPKARRYAQALTTLDQTLQHLDCAWYDGVITDNERLQRNAQLARGFHRACGAMERLARGLAQRVRADDGAAPLNATYQAMLIKRTGRGAGEASPEPPDTDAALPMMTATEAAGLEEMERMAVDLAGPGTATEAPPASASAEVTPESPGAADDTMPESPRAEAEVTPESSSAGIEAMPESLDTTAEATLESPGAADDTMPESSSAGVEATLESPDTTAEVTPERPGAGTAALPPLTEATAATAETASEPASTKKRPSPPSSPARAPKANRFDDIMNQRMTA